MKQTQIGKEQYARRQKEEKERKEKERLEKLARQKEEAIVQGERIEQKIKGRREGRRGNCMRTTLKKYLNVPWNFYYSGRLGPKP